MEEVVNLSFLDKDFDKKSANKKNIFEAFKIKTLNWIKNPYNLAFVGILLLAIAIRLSYFFLTKNQPLWWDEAEYMSAAKNFAGIIHFDYDLAIHRIPGFPLFVSLFYLIGITNESVLRFLVAFIPSIIALALVYFVLTSMYSDKRIALISTAIFSVLWDPLFYSNRFHTENISLIFEFLALIVLFGVYLKKQDFYFIKHKHSLIWIALFTILCIVFRSGNMIFIPIILFFLILVNLYKFSNTIKIVFFAIVGILIIIAINPLGDLINNISAINYILHYELPIYWNAINIFYGFYQSLVPNIPPILFYSFLLGIVLFLVNIVIFPEGLKKVSKNLKNNNYKADLFNLILILGVLFFFIFMFRPGFNDFRWFSILIPGMLAFTSKGLISFGDYFQSAFKIKYLSIILIVFLLLIGLYTQINHADMIIKYKLDSYSQVKDSGEWIKQNSGVNESFVSASVTQHRYYSEREVLDFYVNGSNENESAFDAKVLQNHPKYVVISVFEQAFAPEWTYSWPERHIGQLNVVKTYLDEQNRPLLIIYEVNYSSFK